MSILRPSMLLDFANTQALDPRLSFSRASGGGVQDFRGAWLEALTNYPRFGVSQTTGERLGLLMEGTRSNLIRNPRAEGATAGTPGTLPTNWSSTTTAFGISRSVIANETINGVPCALVRFQGTATATQTLTVLVEAAAVINGTAGQVYTVSALVRAVHSGVNTPTVRFVVREVPTNTDYPLTIAATSTPARFSMVHTVQDAGNTSIRPGFTVAFTSGQVIDTTVAVGLIQCELAAFASAPILPAVGTPAASTRASDLLTLPLSAAGIAADGNCTIFGDFLLPQNSPTGTNQTLLCIDDGTGNNRYRLINALGTNQIRGNVVLAAASADVNAGAMTAGTPFRAAMRVDNGTLSISLNGAAPVSLGSGPTSGLTTLRIGHDQAGGQHAFGFVRRLGIIPRAGSDAALQTLSA